MLASHGANMSGFKAPNPQSQFKPAPTQTKVNASHFMKTDVPRLNPNKHDSIIDYQALKNQSGFKNPSYLASQKHSSLSFGARTMSFGNK